jgi:hypothetical protein
MALLGTSSGKLGGDAFIIAGRRWRQNNLVTQAIFPGLLRHFVPRKRAWYEKNCYNNFSFIACADNGLGRRSYF